MKVRDITTQYENGKGIFNINLEVYDGEILGVLGVNGSGKSTLFKTIIGVIKPSIGYVECPCYGYIPENRSLYKDIKVREHIMLYRRLHHLASEQYDDSVDKWINRLCLDEWIDQTISNLSKGNQQKVQIVCGLLHNPKTVILDEPFTGLDAKNLNDIKNVIRELASNGHQIILSSHQYEEVENLCTKIAILKDGYCKRYGYLKELQQESGQAILEVNQKVIKKYNTLCSQSDMNLVEKEILKLIRKRSNERIIIRSSSIREMVGETYEYFD